MYARVLVCQMTIWEYLTSSGIIKYGCGREFLLCVQTTQSKLRVPGVDSLKVLVGEKLLVPVMQHQHGRAGL